MLSRVDVELTGWNAELACGGHSAQVAMWVSNPAVWLAHSSCEQYRCLLPRDVAVTYS